MLPRWLACVVVLSLGCTASRQAWVPERDFGDYAADTGKLYAFTWAWTYAIDENLRDGVDKFSFDEWGKNVGNGPIWTDGSDNITNNVWHPLVGAFYYEYMRARGYSRLASASQTLLQSFLFEYTIEGIYTEPSSQDLVKTTAIGVPLGIAADETARYLLTSDSLGWRIVGYALNPMYLLPGSRGKPYRVKVDYVQPGVYLVVDF